MSKHDDIVTDLSGLLYLMMGSGFLIGIVCLALDFNVVGAIGICVGLFAFVAFIVGAFYVIIRNIMEGFSRNDHHTG